MRHFVVESKKDSTKVRLCMLWLDPFSLANTGSFVSRHCKTNYSALALNILINAISVWNTVYLTTIRPRHENVYVHYM